MLIANSNLVGCSITLLMYCVRAVMAQRLVRILCDRCKDERRLTANDLAEDFTLSIIAMAGP